MLLTNEKYENVYWTLDLDYIAGDYLTYKTFTDALQEAEESYSLKIHTGTLDEEDWESEYICIQKKDRKIKQCVVKDLRPMAVGLFFYLTKYKKYVIL